jgi:outer membrane receptor for ferrienterochelin and colicin
MDTSRGVGAKFFLVLVQNAVNKSRNSAALYADLEYEITDKWMVNGAVRFENYSDFGNTLKL